MATTKAGVSAHWGGHKLKAIPWVMKWEEDSRRSNTDSVFVAIGVAASGGWRGTTTLLRALLNRTFPPETVNETAIWSFVHVSSVYGKHSVRYSNLRVD